MAEGIFRHRVEAAGLAGKIQVDSSGTCSYHVGERPHPRTQRVLRAHGISYSHGSQQISPRDMAEADYLVAMDRENLQDLKWIDRQGITDGKLSLLLDYAPQVGRRDVPDPYYEGNFERVYRLVEAGCEGLLAHIREEHGV
jgi:protein-tyrosine phosphatase